MIRTDIFEENKRIREDLEKEKWLRREWKKKFYELHKKYKDLEKEKKKLEKKLNQLLNSNTPSSQIPVYLRQYSNTRPEKGTRERGKPKGAKGGCRNPATEFDEYAEAKADVCPRCGSHKIKEKEEDRYSFTVHDIEFKPIKKKATIHVFDCEGCGCIFEGKHPQIPAKGQAGPKLQSFFTILKHHFGGAYKKISDFTRDLLGDAYTPNAINDAVSNVAEILEQSYNQIKEKIKEEKVKKCDETSWPINGKGWWL